MWTLVKDMKHVGIHVLYNATNVNPLALYIFTDMNNLISVKAWIFRFVMLEQMAALQ